jgi:hypothetical protein
MIHEVQPPPPPKLNDSQVIDEIVNDSLGTVDPADTDSDDEMESDPSSRIDD